MFNVRIAVGSIQVAIAQICRENADTVVITNDMNLFAMYPDVKKVLKPVADNRSGMYDKRRILQIRGMRLVNAYHLEYIQAFLNSKTIKETDWGGLRQSWCFNHLHKEMISLISKMPGENPNLEERGPVEPVLVDQEEINLEVEGVQDDMENSTRAAPLDPFCESLFASIREMRPHYLPSH